MIRKNFLVDENDIEKLCGKIPLASESTLFRACIKAALDLPDEILVNYCLQSTAKPGPKREES